VDRSRTAVYSASIPTPQAIITGRNSRADPKSLANSHGTATTPTAGNGYSGIVEDRPTTWM
jgi:hypothetical protein